MRSWSGPLAMSISRVRSEASGPMTSRMAAARVLSLSSPAKMCTMSLLGHRLGAPGWGGVGVVLGGEGAGVKIGVKIVCVGGAPNVWFSATELGTVNVEEGGEEL